MLRKKKAQPKNDDFFSDDPGVMADEHEPMPDVEPVKKKPARSRLLLLLLLLVAIAGGGYFYLLPPVEEAPPLPPAAVVRKPIPPAPAPEKQVAPAAPATAAAPAPEVPAAAPVAKQAVPAAAPVKETPAPAAAKADATPAATAKQTPAAAAPAPAKEAQPKAASAPAAAKYSIDAGAFLVKANREAAEKTIVRLGYEPKVTVVQRPVKMLRLRVGGPYSPMLAEAKLAEVSLLAPNAFSVPKGDELIVYAGSFFIVDEARSLADKLYAEGIRVDEEFVQVKMPLERVSFGSFASKDVAAEALAKAKAAGLNPILVRK